MDLVLHSDERACRRRNEEELRWLGAYHEASHAVVHFAVGAPIAPSISLQPKGVYRARDLKTLAGNLAWVGLAGYIGMNAYNMRCRGKPRWALDGIYTIIVEDSDHWYTAMCLFPNYQPGNRVTGGRIRKALQAECLHVKKLVRANWHVVERVARAAFAAGHLNAGELRTLVEEPCDMVRAWKSPAAEAFDRLVRTTRERFTATLAGANEKVVRSRGVQAAASRLSGNTFTSARSLSR